MFRLLLDGETDGRMNMAVDEALMESAGAPGGRPVLRLYGFSPPALSVGRFQRTRGLVDFDLLKHDGVDFVRRPSGGQAVLHSGELTYAVLVGKDHLSEFGKRYLYQLLVPFLLTGLGELGVRGSSATSTQIGDRLNPDCFGSTGEYEIQGRDGLKMVGSAQMVSRTAIMQHGSIPLNAAGRGVVRYLRGLQPAPNHAGNVGAALSREVSFTEARAAYARAARRLLAAEGTEVTAEERARAQFLRDEKYATDAWNAKL